MEQIEGNIVVRKERNQLAFLLPLLLGALVGGFGGAIFGTLMAPYFSAVKSLGGKLLRRGDSDQPKFELLLQ
jgi:ABC-type xylose transport system permease subunit